MRIVPGCWAPAEGSWESNLVYCSKGGEFKVLGVRGTVAAVGATATTVAAKADKL